MQKIMEIWKNWKGSVGFVGGALVVSTMFFTCSFEPNEEAIKEEVIEKVTEQVEEKVEEEEVEAKEEKVEGQEAPETEAPEAL